MSEFKPPVYIDIASGDQFIGLPAVEHALEAGYHPADIHPIAEVLQDDSIPLGAIERKQRQTKEELAETGRWILNLLNAGNSAKGLRDDIIRRANHLGLIISDYQIARPEMYGGIRNWHRHLGLDDIDKRFEFEGIDIDDVVDHLQMVAGEEGRKPTKQILWRRVREEKKKEMTPRVITSRFPFSYALEMAGYPNIKNVWQDNDYERWGVDYTIANNMRLPDSRSIERLSKQGFGPSTSEIFGRFDNLNNYKDRVYEQTKSPLLEIEAAIDSGALPKEALVDIKAIGDVVTRYKVFCLLNSLMPRTSTQIKANIAASGPKGNNFARLVKSYQPHYTDEFIEAESRRLGSFYYVFPRADHLSNLNFGSRKMRKQSRRTHRDSKVELDRIKRRVIRKSRSFAVVEEHIGGIPVVDTQILENGFVVKRLAQEWTENPHPPESESAGQAIASYRNKEPKKKKYSIRHARKVSAEEAGSSDEADDHETPLDW